MKEIWFDKSPHPQYIFPSHFSFHFLLKSKLTLLPLVGLFIQFYFNKSQLRSPGWILVRICEGRSVSWDKLGVYSNPGKY